MIGQIVGHIPSHILIIMYGQLSLCRIFWCLGADVTQMPKCFVSSYVYTCSLLYSKENTNELAEYVIESHCVLQVWSFVIEIIKDDLILWKL